MRGRRGQRRGVVPARGARAQGRPRRRRRRPRRGRRDRGRPVAARPRGVPARLALQGRRAAGTARAPTSTAPRPSGSRCACRPARSCVDPERGDRWDLTRARPARGGRPRRQRRARQPALRNRDPPGAALRGEGTAGGGALARRSSCKLLADAGLVGLPNAGKSSLLARLTRARPKVADYPFTTLEPVLGTLERDDRQLVLADIPGLIEGASAGAGLGHEFLAHVERCRLLVHVLDLAPVDGSDPVANYATVEAELREHGHGLADLPRLVALSKADLVPADEVEAARAGVGGAGRSAGAGHVGGDRRRRGRAARRDLRAGARGGGRAAGRGSSPPPTASTAPAPASRSASSASARAPSGWRAAASTA